MRRLMGLVISLYFSAAFAQLTVITSMQPHYDLLRQLTAGKAELIRLLPLGASPHTFDPSPKDLLAVSRADLVIVNGGIDEWLLELVEATGTHAPILELLELLEFDPITAADPKSELEDDDHAADDHAADEPGAERTEDSAGEEKTHNHSGTNPHIWLDPVLMIAAVPVLVEALAKADPANAPLYQENGEVLKASLEQLHAELLTMLAPIEGAVFVPFHDAWPYFTRRYGLKLLLEIEPAPGREPSPSYIAKALGQIKETGAKAIFSDIQLPTRPAEVIAKNAGLPLYTLDPEGGGSSEDESYQDFMRKNATTILNALN